MAFDAESIPQPCWIALIVFSVLIALGVMAAIIAAIVVSS